MTNETAPKQPTFREELTQLINKHGLDAQCGVPDYIISNFLHMCFSGFYRSREELSFHERSSSTGSDETKDN